LDPGRDRRGEDVAPSHRILRLVEGISGEADLEVRFRPTFDYARARTEIKALPAGALAIGEGESLTLVSPVPLRIDDAGAAAADVRVRAGDRLWFIMTYRAETSVGADAFAPGEPDTELARTLDYWRRWSAACTYEGPYHAFVRRSALALKLLTFEPTGALIAAPTTSLPEEVGGVRNWDYRYTWLRDASLILYALQSIGYHDEADDFFGWLEQLCIRCRGDLQVVYGIDAAANLTERTLVHLDGYRGSRPVRVGNAAAAQLQLDVYGSVLDAAHLHAMVRDESPASEFWGVLRYLANQAVARWPETDHGIWEVRGGRRHFLYSKLLCWVALDRAISMAERWRLAGEVDRWRETRSAIRDVILERGYDRAVGAFTQALGAPALDASALAIPLVGFLPATDPRVRSTVERIRERLTSRGLVYRYLTEDTDDGLAGKEATFALCSFWLVDNLALGGRVDEARALFERVASFANDVGLLAEEIEPTTGELLGNYPQGFTHLALIRAALSIARAESRGPEERAETPAERAAEAERGGRRAGAPTVPAGRSAGAAERGAEQ
jgi:GH15 family glucan-1,4-alpha-glucosidase